MRRVAMRIHPAAKRNHHERRPCRLPHPVMVSRRRIIDDARAVRFLLLSLAVAAVSCRPTTPDAEPARHVLLITIDTLRADHVGAYGTRRPGTPALDGLARDGARFERALAPRPITLPSHAQPVDRPLPPGHGARHNGIAMGEKVPTLADRFQAGRVRDRRVRRRPSLSIGASASRAASIIYDDELPRSDDGRPLERAPGAETVDGRSPGSSARRDERVFLWVHLFEPHAPYGDAGGRPAAIARATQTKSRRRSRSSAGCSTALGERATATPWWSSPPITARPSASTARSAHSIFVYDTTLHVPLVMRGPAFPEAPSSAATSRSSMCRRPSRPSRGCRNCQSEGQSLAGAFRGGSIGRARSRRVVRAPVRLRLGGAAGGARRRLEVHRGATAGAVRDGQRPCGNDEPGRGGGRAGPPPGCRGVGVERRRAVGALAACGRVGAASARSATWAALSTIPASERPDPKDRIAVAAQMALVTSGEVRGDAAVSALRAILQADPGNPQAHLRLGFAELERNRCDQARPHLQAALDAGVPSADAGLGLAECLGRAGDLDGARRALTDALTIEPGNPVALANLGILALEQEPAPPKRFSRGAGRLRGRFPAARAARRPDRLPLHVLGGRSPALTGAATCGSSRPFHVPSQQHEGHEGYEEHEASAITR